MPNKIKKNKSVCVKNPYAVGHPESDAIVRTPPSRRCVNLKVSGLATRKKTSAE
jgi:hypothetical protein